MTASIDFRAQLAKQLGFLRRSCELFDAGHQDESVRIATALRVLFHQTNRSTSLLKHLDALTVELLSTVETIPPSTLVHTGMGRMRLHGNGRVDYFPALADSCVKVLMPLSEWWTQVVMVVSGNRIMRKHIVLGAANQDGGAHVDSKRESNYEYVTFDGVAGVIRFNVGEEVWCEHVIRDAHLVSLRQMGYEVLHSPSLLALCGS